MDKVLLMVILLLGNLHLGTCSTCADRPVPDIYPGSPFRYMDEPLGLECRVQAPDGQTLDGSLHLQTIDEDSNDMDSPSKVIIRNQTYIELHSIGSVLYIPNRRIQELGYTCVYQTPSCEKDTEHYTLVAFDNRPSAVTRVSCLILHWLKLHCVFDLGEFYRWGPLDSSPDGMVINVDVRGPTSDHRWFPCSQCEYKNRTSRDVLMCVCTKNNEFVLTSGNYDFRVNVTNHFREDSVVSNLSNNLVIVKPDPVHALAVTHVNSTSISVTWKYEAPENLSYFVVLRTDSECSSVSERSARTNSTLMTFVNLEPDTQYVCTITSYPVQHNWRDTSDPANITGRTQPDVPASNPELHPGSFVISPYNLRQVELFWKPILNCQRHGPGLRYEITIEKSADIVHKEVLGEAFSAMLDGYEEDARIDLRACNELGCARNGSGFLYISPQRPRTPDNVTAEVLNATLVTVSWSRTNLSNVTNYTVLFCRSTGNFTCSSPLSTVIVPRNVSDELISLTEGVSQSYIFGVSVEAQTTTGRIISSGISWSKCTRMKFGVPDYPMHSSTEDGADGIHLTWDKYEDCDPLHGQAVFSVLTILNEDKIPVRVEKVMTSKELFLLRYLPPGRYTWSIQGDFPGGSGPASEDRVIIVKDEPNSYLVVIVLSMVAVTTAAVSVLAACCYRSCRRHLKGMDEIKMPEIATSDSGIGNGSDFQSDNTEKRGEERTRLIPEGLHDSGNASNANSSIEEHSKPKYEVNDNTEYAKVHMYGYKAASEDEMGQIYIEMSPMLHDAIHTNTDDTMDERTGIVHTSHSNQTGSGTITESEQEQPVSQGTRHVDDTAGSSNNYVATTDANLRSASPRSDAGRVSNPWGGNADTGYVASTDIQLSSITPEGLTSTDLQLSSITPEGYVASTDPQLSSMTPEGYVVASTDRQLSSTALEGYVASTDLQLSSMTPEGYVASTDRHLSSTALEGYVASTDLQLSSMTPEGYVASTDHQLSSMTPEVT